MSNVPKLRFKEFSGDWESRKLGDITKLTDGVHFTPTYVNVGVPFWSVETVVSNANPKYITQKAHNDAIKRCYPQVNDILLTRIGTLAKPKLIDWDEEFSIYVSIALIKASENYNSKFVRYYFETEYYQKDFLSKSLLTATPKKINMEDLKQTNVSLPSKEEQEKIASFFSLIDDKISLQGEKVEALKDYKKGMMQKIFSRELRFKDDDGRDYPEWEEGKVKDIITEHLYQVDKPLNAYWRLGLRSHGKGTFHEYVTDPSKISMDKLYEVKKNMLILNITFAWEHAIAVTNSDDEGKLVSHRFPTYDFNDNAIYNFYKYYILLPKFKYCLMNASPGGAGRNRVLNKKQFLEIPVPIPCIEEQNKIANILNQLDIKIVKEQEKLDSLNEYKKGLLQQMFV